MNSWHPRSGQAACSTASAAAARRAGSPANWSAGPDTLPEAELAKRCDDLPGEAKQRKHYDDYYGSRTADFAVAIEGAASLGWQTGAAMGLHTSAAISKAISRAGSEQKWLEVHGDTHFTHFYSNYGETLQKRFFGHFLKGEETGWSKSRACR